MLRLDDSKLRASLGYVVTPCQILSRQGSSIHFYYFHPLDPTAMLVGNKCVNLPYDIDKNEFQG
jgi:hypothetical protein